MWKWSLHACQTFFRTRTYWYKCDKYLKKINVLNEIQEKTLFIWLEILSFNGVLFTTFYLTVLIISAGLGHVEIVRELLNQESIDINIKDIWIA